MFTSPTQLDLNEAESNEISFVYSHQATGQYASVLTNFPKSCYRCLQGRFMYTWEESYRAAALEKDRSKLPERIRAALAVINRRVHELHDGKGSANERAAVREALDVLIILSIVSDESERPTPWQ